jgi:hypothetical protein
MNKKRVPTKYKNHGLCSISNDVHYKYLTILVSEKIELACLSDAHAALKNLSKKRVWNKSLLQAAHCAKRHDCYTNPLATTQKTLKH